ncbi:NB-ARC domain-containing protein [Actinoplanes sp. NPDC048796]|uniref:NB-ARC domain-containing protein n=1 Tax=Actinoplanes sp. NPDC048796 TaxID=3155640 RepID=UPI0033F72538
MRSSAPRSWFVLLGLVVVAAGAGWLVSTHPSTVVVALIVVATGAAASVVWIAEATGLKRRSAVEPPESGTKALAPDAARVPDQIPLSLDSFRGRVNELRELADRHARGRAERTGRASAGALVIMLHGRPGVGKSAIAREFALTIAPEYPDGRLYANLGIGGDRRPPGEILKKFLIALGWPDELPPSPAARARIFRSLLADKRILIVLDAARDADQLRVLLPTSPGCTVVVTSRRNLSPVVAPSSRSLHIDVPRFRDAMAIVRTAAGLGPQAYPSEVARIAVECGSLPIALQAVGEKVAATGSLPAVADSLADPDGRLAALAYHNRDIAGRLEIEYARLTPQEQIALHRLGAIGSDTFLPWLLAPLMDCSNAEAEDLMAKLYAAQFIDVSGADMPSGLARYRFHPLFRLFARRHAAGDPGRHEARHRLYQAYLAIIAEVIRLEEPGFDSGRTLEARGYLHGTTIPRRIRDYVDEWTRTEYVNLVASVHSAADADDGALCWRIARRLGGHLPPGLDQAETRRAFERASAAAERDPSGYARIAVRVAWSEFLLETERHDSGLRMARGAIDEGRRAPADERVAVEALRAHRVLATALLDAGQAASAHAEALRGLAHAERSVPLRSPVLAARLSADRQLVRLVRDAARAATRPEPGNPVTIQHLADENMDAPRFRLSLMLADVARRRRDWQTATESLLVAAVAARGDVRRLAMVDHRRARLTLSQAEESNGSESVRLGSEAIDRAARAVVGFEGLGCGLSAARSRLLLARTLLAAGLVDEAEEQLPVAGRHLTGRGPEADGVRGRARLVQAEIALAQGRTGDALDELEGAEGLFRPEQDWAAIAATAALRGRIRDRAGEVGPAAAAMTEALLAWRAVRDTHAPLVLMRHVSYEVAAHLPAAEEAVTPGEHRLSERVALTQRAFRQAGVELSRGEEPELLVPGPVWVAAETAPSAAEVHRFERHLGVDGVAHLVHVEPIDPDGEAALDALRLRTQPVITVRVDALRAAYTDKRAKDFLKELNRTRGPQNTLFESRNAIEDERWLFGRDAMLNTIGSALRQDEQILLTGLRKVGKTSLLNILRQRLADRPVCKVDLQMFDRRREEWPLELFRQMVTAYDNWAADAWADWSFQPTTPRTATELAGEIGRRTEVTGRKLIVILDELERIYPRADEDDAVERWVYGTGALRAMAQGTTRLVALIAADLRPNANRRNDLGADRTNPFFQFFREIPLPLLGKDAVAGMTTALGQAAGAGEVTAGFHDEMFRLTGGHPTLARMVAGGAYRAMTTGVMDRASLERGLVEHDVTINVDDFLTSLWRMLTDAERSVLRGAAPRSPATRAAYASLRAHGILDDRGIAIGLLADRVTEFGDRS